LGTLLFKKFLIFCLKSFRKESSNVIYGHGATVAYGSPKPLIWVRILVPVQKNWIMNKISAYIKDSYRELLEKVTWPSWQELQQSTMIVLIATLLITALVGVMDLASNTILKFIYSLFK
jgi:preprotein translocase subunit SecE